MIGIWEKFDLNKIKGLPNADMPILSQSPSYITLHHAWLAFSSSTDRQNELISRHVLGHSTSDTHSRRCSAVAQLVHLGSNAECYPSAVAIAGSPLSLSELACTP